MYGMYINERVTFVTSPYFLSFLSFPILLSFHVIYLASLSLESRLNSWRRETEGLESKQTRPTLLWMYVLLYNKIIPVHTTCISWLRSSKKEKGASIVNVAKKDMDVDVLKNQRKKEIHFQLNVAHRGMTVMYVRFNPRFHTVHPFSAFLNCKKVRWMDHQGFFLSLWLPLNLVIMWNT